MKNKFAGHFCSAALLLASASAFAVVPPAPTPVTIKYLFNTTTVGTFANPGLDANITIPASLSNFSAWSDVDGTLSNLLGVGSSRAISATGWDGPSGNAFVFKFDVAPGFVLDISSITFLEQGSNGAGRGFGPTDWKLSIEGTQVWDGTGLGTRGSFGSHTNDALPGVGKLGGTIDFLLFATGAAASGANPASSGTWRVDNFTITGTVRPVPLPAAVWLLGSAVVGIAGLRRRAA